LQRKISVNGKDQKKYFRMVEAEDLVIPGFEQLKLFTHLEFIDPNIYCVSESTTGLSIVNANLNIKSKTDAINLATEKLQKHGLELVLKIIADCPKVDSLPEYVELEKVE
jgi:hypothetical protein